jgi:multicomponent Na+:H+ antiporter subunit F
VIEFIYFGSELLVGFSALLILIRVFRGPSVFDRVLAVEALALAVVGYLLLEAYTRGGRLYVDAALGLALFSFVATVMLTYFLGRGDFSDE